MNRLKIQVVIGACAMISVAAFQNCSGNFSSTAASSSGSTSGSGVMPSPTPSDDACLSSVALPTSVAGLDPRSLRKLNGANLLANCGAGQTIAVIGSALSEDIRGALTAYSQAYGLPVPDSNSFQLIRPGGACDQTGSALQAHIDVEMVHAMAPKATILLVCPSSSATSDRSIAINAAISHGASVVEMSWGAVETQADISTLDAVFSANPHVTFVAASGDSGSDNDSSGNPRVFYPASSQFVLAVGAHADDGGEHLVVWSGTGGGMSALVSRPAYQSTIAFTGTGRLLPDFSMNGSSTTPVAIYMNGGFMASGAYGTGVAAPLGASLVVLANELHGTPLGDVHAPLYAAMSSGALSTYFRDVTSGNNGLYQALVGFDLTSGLGTPRAAQVLPLLAH